MAQFDLAIPFVLAHEGGLVDHPADPGGTTNYGVSLRWLRSLEGTAGDIDGDGDVDADDVRALTVADAKRLYREYFWLPRFDQIRAQNVATKIFDTAVNVGVRRATRLVQQALSGFSPIIIDGVFGPETVARLNGAVARNSTTTMMALRYQQAEFYVGLVNARRSRDVFLLGWLNRALS